GASGDVGYLGVPRKERDHTRVGQGQGDRRERRAARRAPLGVAMLARAKKFPCPDRVMGGYSYGPTACSIARKRVTNARSAVLPWRVRRHGHSCPGCVSM